MIKLILITISMLLGMRLITFTLGLAGVLSWKKFQKQGNWHVRIRRRPEDIKATR
jgi:hypothetical protein